MSLRSFNTPSWSPAAVSSRRLWFIALVSILTGIWCPTDMHTWGMQIKLHGRLSNFRKSGGAIGDTDSHQPAALGSCPPSRASCGLRWTRAVSWRSLLAKPPTKFKQNTRSDLALLQIRDVSWLYVVPSSAKPIHLKFSFEPSVLSTQSLVPHEDQYSPSLRILCVTLSCSRCIRNITGGSNA